MDWVQTALEEYRTLRQESLEAIAGQQRTLQLGLVSIGVLTGFAASVTTSENTARGLETAAYLAVAVAAPAIALIVIVLWLEETRRAVRAGAFLSGLETRIANAFDGPPPLTWETDIQRAAGERGQYVYHWGVGLTLLVASVPTIALGLVGLANESRWEAFGVGLAAILAIVGVSITYQARAHKRLTSIQAKAVADLEAAQSA
jgi:Na+/proline symporter